MQVLTQGGGDRGCPTGRRPHAPPGRSPCRSGVRDEASAHHASRPPVVCTGEGYRDETRVRRGMSQGEEGVEGRGGVVGAGSGARGRRGPTKGAAGAALSGYNWLRRGLAPKQREVGNSLSCIEHS